MHTESTRSRFSLVKALEWYRMLRYSPELEQSRDSVTFGTFFFRLTVQRTVTVEERGKVEVFVRMGKFFEHIARNSRAPYAMRYTFDGEMWYFRCCNERVKISRNVDRKK